MTAAWWQQPMVAFDTETTGVDPETARIVTAAAVLVGPNGVGWRRSWLADPGVEIPKEAADIHGISTEHARTHGQPAARVVTEVAAVLRAAWNAGHPVVGMNLSYDLTLLLREMARHGLGGLDVGPCLDPYVIDRACDLYRKGKRRLEDLAAHYGVKLDEAHSAEQDALAAARVLWVQVCAKKPRYPQLRTMTLVEMQAWQARHHAERQASFQQYLRTKADPKQPDATVDGSWPYRPALTEVP